MSPIRLLRSPSHSPSRSLSRSPSPPGSPTADRSPSPPLQWAPAHGERSFASEAYSAYHGYVRRQQLHDALRSEAEMEALAASAAMAGSAPMRDAGTSPVITLL